jgi:hypothetical protein
MLNKFILWIISLFGYTLTKIDSPPVLEEGLSKPIEKEYIPEMKVEKSPLLDIIEEFKKESNTTLTGDLYTDLACWLLKIEPSDLEDFLSNYKTFCTIRDILPNKNIEEFAARPRTVLMKMFKLSPSELFFAQKLSQVNDIMQKNSIILDRLGLSKYSLDTIKEKVFSSKGSNSNLRVEFVDLMHKIYAGSEDHMEYTAEDSDQYMSLVTKLISRVDNLHKSGKYAMFNYTAEEIEKAMELLAAMYFIAIQNKVETDNENIKNEQQQVVQINSEKSKDLRYYLFISANGLVKRQFLLDKEFSKSDTIFPESFETPTVVKVDEREFSLITNKEFVVDIFESNYEGEVGKFLGNYEISYNYPNQTARFKKTANYLQKNILYVDVDTEIQAKDDKFGISGLKLLRAYLLKYPNGGSFFVYDSVTRKFLGACMNSHMARTSEDKIVTIYPYTSNDKDFTKNLKEVIDIKKSLSVLELEVEGETLSQVYFRDEYVSNGITTWEFVGKNSIVAIKGALNGSIELYSSGFYEEAKENIYLDKYVNLYIGGVNFGKFIVDGASDASHTIKLKREKDEKIEIPVLDIFNSTTSSTKTIIKEVERQPEVKRKRISKNKVDNVLEII